MFRKLAWAPFIYYITDLGANLAGWLFSLMAIRTLTLEALSDFGFTVSAITFIGISSSAIQLSTNAVGANPSHWGASETEVSRIGHLSLMASIGLSGLVLLLSPFWTEFFQTNQSEAYLASIGLLLLSTFILPWQRGLLLSQSRYVITAFWVWIEICLKLLFGFWAMIQGRLWLFVLAMGLPAMVSLLGAWPLIQTNWHQEMWLKWRLSPKVLQLLLQSVWLRLGVSLLFSLDVLLAKHYLEPVQAGVYVLLSMVGKVMFFLVHSSGSLLVPMLAKYLQTSWRYGILLATVLFTLFTQLGLLGLIYAFPQYTLGKLMGPKYVMITNYVLPYGLIAIGLSVAMVLSLYLILRQYQWFTFLILFHLLLLYSLIVLHHNSIAHFIQMMGINTLLLLLNLSFFIFRAHQTKLLIYLKQPQLLLYKAIVLTRKLWSFTYYFR